MSWSFLSFLGEPWFVIPWYAVGLAGVWLVIYDVRNHNTVLKPAMKWAWPVIVLFFSVIGIALYFLTARAPGIGELKDEEQKEKAHNEYEKSMWRRVNGASSHCVAGDGFGIMTAMVIARAGGLSFWQEFWFEYVVGFAIGWFVFQRKSMTMMTGDLGKQLAMAFRAELFSMLTVMGGMGAVMTYVTPSVATAQPKPLTAAFWGFGMLGLLVGYVLTFPMNWLLVMIGWKHGMGGEEGATKVERKPAKYGLFATMAALGCAAILLPAWLTLVRERAPIQDEQAATTPAQRANVGQALYGGLRSSIERAHAALQRGDRAGAARMMDATFHAAEVGTYSSPGAFYSALEQIKNARYALQQGQPHQADRHLANALEVLKPAEQATPPFLDLHQYAGATVLDAQGEVIGEVVGVSGDSLELALGGWRDAWGFLDFSSRRHVQVPAGQLAFGPPRAIGMTMVVLPTRASPVASGDRQDRGAPRANCDSVVGARPRSPATGVPDSLDQRSMPSRKPIFSGPNSS